MRYMTERERRQKKLNDILTSLTYDLQKGWQAYCASKYLQMMWETGETQGKMIPLLSISQRACFELAYLTLAKLTEKSEDSISVLFLLDYVKNNTNLVAKSLKTPILAQVDKHQKQIDVISISTGSALKRLRDKTIAHTDRVNINDPTREYYFPTEDEIEELFAQLLNIINTYAQYLAPSRQTILGQIEPIIADNVKFLASLIKQHAQDEFERMQSSWQKYQ